MFTLPPLPSTVFFCSTTSCGADGAFPETLINPSEISASFQPIATSDALIATSGTPDFFCSFMYSKSSFVIMRSSPFKDITKALCQFTIVNIKKHAPGARLNYQISKKLENSRGGEILEPFETSHCALISFKFHLPSVVERVFSANIFDLGQQS